MSNGRPTGIKGLAFVGGAIESRNRIAFACQPMDAVKNKQELSRLVFWESGKWIDGGQFTWTPVGVTAAPSADTIMVGRNGEVAIWRGGKPSEERIAVAGRSVGPLRGVRYVEKEAFAYGMGREIYRRTNQGWVQFEDGLQKPAVPAGASLRERIRAKATNQGGITSVDGQAANDLYAVGFRGEIYHSTGSAWAALHSPTDVILRDLAVATNGDVFVCGQMGIVLRLRGTSCEIVKYDGPGNLDFFSIACFGEKVFLADGHSLHVLDGGILSLVNFGMTDGVPPSSSLDERDGTILSVAGLEVYASSDGVAWDPLVN
jgi:hypothetical protein